MKNIKINILTTYNFSLWMEKSQREALDYSVTNIFPVPGRLKLSVTCLAPRTWKS
jgi:hypothetical protein